MNSDTNGVNWRRLLRTVAIVVAIGLALLVLQALLGSTGHGR